MKDLQELPATRQLEVLDTNAVISVLAQDHAEEILELLSQLNEQYPDKVKKVIQSRITLYSLQSGCIRRGLAVEDDFEKIKGAGRIVSRAGRGPDSISPP